MAVLVSAIKTNVINKIGLSSSEGSLVLTWLTEGFRDLKQKLPLTLVADPAADFAGTEDVTATLLFPTIGPYALALEYYALWQAAEYDDKGTSQRALDYRKQYEQFVIEAYAAAAASATGGTVNALKINIRNKLGMAISESALILTYLTQGYRDLLSRTGFYQQTTTVAITSGTASYELAATIGEIEDLTIVGSSVKPDRVTREEMNDLRRAASTGAAGDVWCYSLEGNYLMLYPTPTSSFNITIFYVAEYAITDLAGTEAIAADLKMVPQGPLAEALEQYGMMRSLEYIDHGPSKRSQQAREEYESLVIKARKAVRQRSGRGLLGAKVGYPARRGYPSANSVYPGGG